MNNQPERIDPHTGSAMFHRIAPGSHALNSPLPDSARTGVAADAAPDDPKRHIAVHWPDHPTGFRAQQGSPGPVPDPACIPALEVGYRHVVDRLLKCWDNVEAFAVVHHDLVIDTRGDRAGWPADVWSDLVLLQEIHDEAYGTLAPGAEPWKSFFLSN